MQISTTRGTALYVGALLGPGLLVLPGLAAAQAGPASILAWAGLLVLSGLVAMVFTRFGVERPSAAGVADYTAFGLGDRAGRAVGWCFLAGIITGAPIVCTMGAGYLAALAGAGHVGTALAGGVTLTVMLALSLRGLRASTTVQLALVAVLLLVIVVAVAGALPHATAAGFTPFAPHGWPAIGGAASVLMLSFVGWEAVAPLTGRFADPRRQLPRVIGAAFAITAVVYVALALITIAALGPRAATEVPMAALLTLAIGGAGHAVAAIAALLLTLGAVNAYLAGGAALSRTLSRRPQAHWFPVSVAGSGVVILGLIGAGVISVAGAIAVPAAFFLVVYLGCMLSAARSMPGRTRVLAGIAAGAILVVFGFAGPAAIPAVLVAAVAAGTGPVSRGAGSRLGTDSPSTSRPVPGRGTARIGRRRRRIV